MYNFMYSSLSDRSDRSKLDVREINTRPQDAPLFKVKVLKLKAYKRSVEYRGSVQWNSLVSE